MRWFVQARCRWAVIKRIYIGVFAFCCLTLFAHAGDIHTIAVLGDLVDIVDVAWTNNSMAKVVPPGDTTYNNDLDVIAYEPGFETNFLASLIAVTNGTGTNAFILYPIKVVETTNGSDRVRHYFSAVSANPTTVHTATVVIANYPEDWIEETYGEAPEWLSGNDLQAWYDDRDPWRQHMFCDLIATGSIPDYITMLTNAIGYYSNGTNTNSMLTVYSNDIAFVQYNTGTEGISLYLHAPDDVPTLDVFKSTNLMDTYGWDLPATLDHNVDPILWTSTDSDVLAFFSMGNASADTDGDGLSDAREIRMFGTSAYQADSDGDGLTDGEEIMTYDLDALNSDTDGDGLSDGEEVDLGTSPGSDDSDGDGITDYDEVYTYFGHVDPMDADSDDDGLNDYVEVITEETYAAPDCGRARDTDDDDLSDYAEVITHSTDPLLVDSDGDGIDDDYEIFYGWDPNDSGTATEDEDEDGFDNLTEYRWRYQPTISNNTPPTTQSLILCPHGSNSISHSESRLLAVGDQGDYTARIRIRPLYKNGDLAEQRLYHTQTPGFYIDGTEASSVASPINVSASSVAIEYAISSDATAIGTNLRFRITTTNEPTATKDSVCCYFPEVEDVKFSGPNNDYVYIDYGETNTLWLNMPDDTNACRVYMRPRQETSPMYGIPNFTYNNKLLVKITGSGADPATSTLSQLDWKSAYGVSCNTAHTRGIRLDPGSYTFEVGYDMDGNGTLDASEVQVTCYINVVTMDADVDTNNDGDIDEDNNGEDVFEEYEPGVIICETFDGDDTNTDHLVEIKFSVEPTELTTGTVYIVASSGGSRIKLWTDANKTSEVTLPASYDLSISNPPSSLWIDGVDTGEAVIDFYYKNPDDDEVMRDKVAVYVTKTLSWGPNGYYDLFPYKTRLYSWGPLNWTNDSFGQSSGPIDVVLEQATNQGWVAKGYTFEDTTPRDDDCGTCNLINFKELAYAGLLALHAHGTSTLVSAVYLETEAAADAWRSGESGMTTYRWEEENIYSVDVSSSWFSSNWKSTHDLRKSLTTFVSCYAAKDTGSPVPSSGGRTMLGYTNTVYVYQAEYNNRKLFKRMSGTLDNGDLRSAFDAFGDGSGYSGDDIVMLGNGWTTLCPAVVEHYPNGNPGDRTGWGCVLFDTYMDDSIAADAALVKTAGGATVSNMRWLSNEYGAYGVGFDFENRTEAGATLRAVAEKCVHKSSVGGEGRQLDGDGVTPNGDDLEWNF